MLTPFLSGSMGTARYGVPSGAATFHDSFASSAATQDALAYHLAGRPNFSVNASVRVNHPLVKAATTVVTATVKNSGSAGYRDFSIQIEDGYFIITTTAVVTTAFGVLSACCGRSPTSERLTHDRI